MVRRSGRQAVERAGLCECEGVRRHGALARGRDLQKNVLKVLPPALGKLEALTEL